MNYMTGGYVRHRHRMVQESVIEDLKNTLLVCGWMTGTVTRPVYAPDGTLVAAGTNISTSLPLIRGNEVTVIDYFPEAEGDATAGTTDGATAPNTLAVDGGTRGESVERELGSTAEVVPYTFNLAFYASSDAVALAVLDDLSDRYAGRIVQDQTIDLWDYNATDAVNPERLTLPVARMDVEYFQYQLASDQSIAPHEVHLYFAELGIVDDVD